MRSVGCLHSAIRILLVNSVFTVIMLAAMILTRCAVIRFLNRFGIRV